MRLDLRLGCGGLLFGKLPLRAARRLVQRGQNGIVHRVEDLPLREELDLCLGRMDVHVHGLHGHIDLEHAGREAADHDLVAVRLLHGGGKQPRLDVAVIDKEALPGAVAARGGGAGDEAAHAQLFPAAVH